MSLDVNNRVEVTYINEMVMCQQCLRTQKREPNCTAFCIECNESLCQLCSTSHAVNKTSRHHNMKAFKDVFELNKHYDEISSISKLVKCRNHPMETMRYMCNNHNVVCCEKCVSVFGEHRPCNGVKILDELASQGNAEAFGDLIKFGKQLAEIEQNSDKRGKCVDDIGTRIIDATQQLVNETKESWKKDIAELKAVLITLQTQFEGMKLIGNNAYQYLLVHTITKITPQITETIDNIKRQQACNPSIEDAMDDICTKLKVKGCMSSHIATENIAECRPVSPIKDYDSIASFQILEGAGVESRDGTRGHQSIDTGNERHELPWIPNHNQPLRIHEKPPRLSNSYPSRVYREPTQHYKYSRFSMPLPVDMEQTAVKSVVGQPFVRIAQENPYTQLHRNWYLNVPGHVRYAAYGPPTYACYSEEQIGKRKTTFGGSLSPNPKKQNRPLSFFGFLKGRQSSDHKK
ncbi:hypothetical protein DPMN_172521 [Dreissena polymorpha]|uniref:B box-type domain-containing protein n=1 Tax=Dreissena polymorpha TaxID=45954 RepID=A0A9D4IER0_DREPO|nr:hypothetical protein DPMN_172521 [Dreissena polymorpha]